MTVKQTIMAATGVANKMTAPQPRLGSGYVRIESAIDTILRGMMSMIIIPITSIIRKAITLPITALAIPAARAAPAGSSTSGTLWVVVPPTQAPDWILASFSLV